jgi:alkaline phosphatase D
VILSGDVHTHWAADVKAVPDDPTSPTLGAELTASSITSGGDGSDQLPFWPAIRSDNPHVHYHGNRRGYIASEVTSAGWTADFKALDGVSRQRQPQRTAQTVMIEPGRCGVQS